MPNPIIGMKSERHRNTKLQQHLRSNGQRPEGSRHARAIEMPSEERSAEVGGAEDIEAAAENAPSDTIKSGEVPADLGLVD